MKQSIIIPFPLLELSMTKRIEPEKTTIGSIVIVINTKNLSR